MATFDTSTIEGFDQMTAEQKLDAVLKAEIPDKVDMSGYVEKSVFDKKAAEASSLSKQLRAKMTEEEQKKLEAEEAKAADAQKFAEMEAKNAELEKKITISEYKANFLAQGYDEKLAAETAAALANGDMAKVFANAEKFKTALEAKIKSDLMDKTPKPGGGTGGSENPGLEQAKSIGKAKAEADKATADVMKHYIH